MFDAITNQLHLCYQTLNFQAIPEELGFGIFQDRWNNSTISLQQYRKEFRKIWDGKNYLDKFYKINEGVLKQLQSSRILCLTRSAFMHNMWGYYGESHKGVALEFQAPICTQSRFTQAWEVDYLDQPPVIASLNDIVGWLFQQLEPLPTQIARAMFTTKHTDWLTEKEYRIITTRENANSDFDDLPFEDNELRAV
ncbi:hypothetical protein PsAD2_01675 [Pseudovibrio axinellae]|uniref:DUF2971 domain-containing protein n=1 Tax=Pseudovibrio axinellae TaxID=989403 RepID=A0A165ZFY9_9HYPH|nr:DUF2971 domain-containing protein [Pseudovibrio axinellae]KZL19853.1 hypothetical protein PsAD2_01675 [Pseudovibrio axinellae]SER39149.1 Protein of unknown function [Pseudovibrio axinellae]